MQLLVRKHFTRMVRDGSPWQVELEWNISLSYDAFIAKRVDELLVALAKFLLKYCSNVIDSSNSR